jgi:hypothetical protein
MEKRSGSSIIDTELGSKVKEEAHGWGTPIIEAPKGRRDKFGEPHFKGAAPDQIVVILKAREPATRVSL